MRILTQDKHSRVACETLLNTGLCVVAGEITTGATVDYGQVARDTIKRIGYDSSEIGFDYHTCAVMTAIGKQSQDNGIGRAQANERWYTWQGLTAGQRKQLRKAWARFRELTPEQQQAMRAAFYRHQQSPVNDRSYVSDDWMDMTPDEQLRAIERRRAPGPQPGAFDKRNCPPC